MKNPREFELTRWSREAGVGGSGLELTLRNSLNQRVLARECVQWICSRGMFKSARMSRSIKGILEGCTRFEAFKVDPATFLAQVSATITRAKDE